MTTLPDYPQVKGGQSDLPFFANRNSSTYFLFTLLLADGEINQLAAETLPISVELAMEPEEATVVS